MSFQIKDNTGKALLMRELDAEAAEFMKIPVDDKYYAGGWFDSIGWCISRRTCNTWADVRTSMDELYGDTLVTDKHLMNVIIPLMNHWEHKGYTPHTVN